MGFEFKDQNFDETGRTENDVTSYATTVEEGQVQADISLGKTSPGMTVTFNNPISADGTYAPVAGTFDEIMAQLSSVDVGAIGRAQLAWKYAAEALDMLGAERLPQIASTLSTVWSGEAAAEAQQALQITAATAVALKNESVQMGHTTDYAHEMATFYTAEENRVGYGLIKTGSDDAVAQDYLQRYMDRYTEAIEIAPKEVQAQLKSVDPSRWSQEDLSSSVDSGGGTNASSQVSSTGGYGGSAGTSFTDSVSSGRAAGGDSFAVDRSLFGSEGSLAGTGSSSGLGGGLGGSSFSGTSGGWGSPASGLGTTGLGGTGAGFAGSAVSGSGLSAGRGGLFPGGGGVAGGGSAGRSGMSGALSEEALSQGRGGAASARGAGGMMAAPMGAGGQGQDDEERERYAWMMEDEDVWGAKTDAPPSIISE